MKYKDRLQDHRPDRHQDPPRNRLPNQYLITPQALDQAELSVGH